MTITLSRSLYDGFGNVVTEAAPNGRCRDVTYASDYSDLPTSETVYVGAPTGACAVGGGARGATGLTAVAGYDRGLGAVTNVFDLHGEPSLVAYDDLGRLVAMTKPSAAARVLSPNPAVTIDYDLAHPGRPYSVVHASAQVGATEADNTRRDTFAYVDGMGRAVVTIDEADPSAGDGGAWIVSGLTNRDAKGATERAYLAAFYDGDPRAYPLALAPSTPYSRQRYDAFGRAVQAFGLDGEVTLQSSYHALSADHADAADLMPGPHQGTPASAVQDGHGRTTVVTERIHNGGSIEARETVTTYRATGEPLTITRVREGASDAPVVRWLAYDSLGRMVANVEPDTTKNFTPTPVAIALAPGTMKTWRYAYDDNGDLVGTSDARGCGTNYAYDAGGRIVSEDYSPCTAAQVAYSAPTPTTGDGTEVLYTYDGLDADAQSITCPPSGSACFPIDPTLLTGRLTIVSDRGAKTVTRYDGRGRVTGIARKLAAPGTPSDTLASRYTPHWYTQTTTFDAADRPVTATTGVDPDIAQLLDPTGQSAVTTQYSLRNAVSSVTSGYGPLVTSITRDADGLIANTVYGDAASTQSAFTYDGRRRIASVQTYRGAPAIWSSPPASYQPPPAPGGAPSTFQLLLEDVDYHYDEVDNPVEIDDFRNPSEWPAGAAPVTRTMQYDDLYRVTGVDYQYRTGTDPWTSPFDAEDRSVDTDPRRAKPSPHVAFADRVLSQSFAYDWLGNTSQTDDDAHGFYDRSLGTITNGTASRGPYQLQTAASAASALSGSLSAVYDDAGNLTSLSVTRAGPCLPAGAVCSQRFAYDWDEVGRLARARRWDLAAPGAASSALPTSAPSAELVYAYDASDERTLKTAVDANNNELFSAYVFDSLELRRTTNDGTDYVRNPLTEVGYLFAHDVRLARLHFVESGNGFVAPTAGSGGAGTGANGDAGTSGRTDGGAVDAGSTISISGTASNTNGGPIAGVSVQITGNVQETAKTDANGHFAFAGLAKGSYGLSAALANCNFSLSLLHLNNLTASVVENFTGEGTGCGTAFGTPPPPTPLSISGRVTNANGVGIVGVSLQINGNAQGTVLTDGAGNYAFGGLTPGSYSLTLSAASCTLAPSSPSFNNIAASVVQNFAASGAGCVLGGTDSPTETSSQLHVLFELPDHLGSTSLVVDKDTSELVEESTYLAYGQAESDYRPARWDSFREDSRFTGKEEDIEIGLQYFGKRFLSSYLGRWASADPLAVHGLGADANVYAYVHGRVLIAIDQLGLESPIAGAPSADNPPDNGTCSGCTDKVVDTLKGAAAGFADSVIDAAAAVPHVMNQMAASNSIPPAARGRH